MRNVLILGAGKSSTVLIDYLVEHAAAQQWLVIVADITVDLALKKTANRPNTWALAFELNNETARRELITRSDIVVSMLPAMFHSMIALDCLALKKHLVTPSYITDKMKEMHAEAERNGLVFLNEMGLDPGIDHMSAMQILDNLKGQGATILGFESHCGGLIAPESDDNPWHYKFTWNPRNVVLAGQGAGGIHYLRGGQHVELKYEELFGNPTVMEVQGYGQFESYPNRDSLKYISDYGLDTVQTMYRGTLRIPPYCRGWNALVLMGFTQEIELEAKPFIQHAQTSIAAILNGIDLAMIQLFRYLELDEVLAAYADKVINPAKLLQAVLEQKWVMKPGDKDLVVMVHHITYMQNQAVYKLQSSFVSVGKDEAYTAMAATVGLPVAMGVKQILNGALTNKGVIMPKYAEIYNPILAELKNYGITFSEQFL